MKRRVRRAGVLALLAILLLPGAALQARTGSGEPLKANSAGEDATAAARKKKPKKPPKPRPGFPDVGKTPSTPGPVPVPYPNTID